MIYSTLLLVGALFLLATLVCHLLVPQLRRAVRGLSLMAHCACMLVAHITFIVLAFVGEWIPDGPCHFLGEISRNILIGLY